MTKIKGILSLIIFGNNKKENKKPWVLTDKAVMRCNNPVPTQLKNIKYNNYLNVWIGEAEVAESGIALDLRSSSYTGTWVQNGTMKIPASALSFGVRN